MSFKRAALSCEEAAAADVVERGGASCGAAGVFARALWGGCVSRTASALEAAPPERDGCGGSAEAAGVDGVATLSSIIQGSCSLGALDGEGVERSDGGSTDATCFTSCAGFVGLAGRDGGGGAEDCVAGVGGAEDAGLAGRFAVPRGASDRRGLADRFALDCSGSR